MTISKTNYVLINSRTIENNVRNLSQLTFEVTDGCNLQCKYCGYGETYNGYDKREDKFLSIEKAITLLEYMKNMWQSKQSQSIRKKTYISFYGGEPLLNLPFIEKVVEWVNAERASIPYCDFEFTMTTNAVLINRYIDYLVKHNFHILVSLDGDEYNDSYRVDHSGHPSFKRVMENVLAIQENYPDYFKENIRFNSVLHNRNSYDSIIRFFREKFDTQPSIAELNPMNIEDEKRFLSMLNTKADSLRDSSNRKEVEETLFISNVATDALCTYVYHHSGNVFKTYNELLCVDRRNYIPTGTCLPFGKKMFVTVNGKILPCERISQNYSLGTVDETGVHLDFEEVAAKYNRLYEKYIPQCKHCYHQHTCKQCMFYNPNLETTGICPYRMSQQAFNEYRECNLNYLREHPNLYQRIMKEVILH
jgi:uncharacterized protein